MSPELQINDISMAFGGLKVNTDISFSLFPGDRVALIGPNGAGKTTLVNVISGALKPSAGRIVLAGQDVTHWPTPRRVRGGLVRTFQITHLFPTLTVAENVALAVLQKKDLAWRFASELTQTAAIRNEWMECLDLLGIGHLHDRPVHKLAYGQQRLLDLAIGLALTPRILILDEPAAGVPHDEAARILEAIDRLPRDIAVLMIEHDMDLVFRFARRVLVLANGRLVFEGTPEEVTRDEDVRHAYLGSYAK